MQGRLRPTVGLIYIPALADALGYGLMLPALPRLIAGMTGGDMARAALCGGWLVFTYAAVQIFFAPLLGNLGDRYGRRPVLLASLFPLAFDSLLLAAAPSVGWLFAGKVVGGGIGGSFSLASAYVADITPPRARARNFAILNSSAGVGMILGPVLGGLLARHNLYLPCYAAAGVAAANILYTSLFVPESLGAANRRQMEWRRANPLGAVSDLRRSHVVWGLVLVLGIYYIANDVMESVWSYFTIEKFRWSETQIGWSLGTMGLAFALIQAFVCPWLLPRLGERRSIYLGLGLQAAAFAALAFAPRGWMLFALMIPLGAGTIFGPAIQSMTANRMPDDRQGELQGGLAALRNLTSIAGPPMMAGVFSLFAGRAAVFYFPSMPLILSAALMLAALAAVRRILASDSSNKP